MSLVSEWWIAWLCDYMNGLRCNLILWMINFKRWYVTTVNSFSLLLWCWLGWFLVSCRFCKSLFLRLEEELSAIRSAVSNLNSQDHDRLGCLGHCSIIHVGSSDIASTVTYQVQVFMSYWDALSIVWCTEDCILTMLTYFGYEKWSGLLLLRGTSSTVLPP